MVPLRDCSDQDYLNRRVVHKQILHAVRIRDLKRELLFTFAAFIAHSWLLYLFLVKFIVFMPCPFLSRMLVEGKHIEVHQRHGGWHLLASSSQPVTIQIAALRLGMKLTFMVQTTQTLEQSRVIDPHAMLVVQANSFNIRCIDACAVSFTSSVWVFNLKHRFTNWVD